MSPALPDLRRFRFGVMPSERFAPHMPLPRNRQGWVDKALELEDLGYSTVTLTDHADAAYAPPLLGLMAAAGVTGRLRLGTMVLAADLRHPFMLAKEAAMLTVASSGASASAGMQGTTPPPA